MDKMKPTSKHLPKRRFTTSGQLFPPPITECFVNTNTLSYFVRFGWHERLCVDLFHYIRIFLTSVHFLYLINPSLSIPFYRYFAESVFVQKPTTSKGGEKLPGHYGLWPGRKKKAEKFFLAEIGGWKMPAGSSNWPALAQKREYATTIA